MIDLKELRELAEKATPGPWHQEKYDADGSGDLMPRIHNQIIELATTTFLRGSSTQHIANAAFIAALNPKTALELLDRIEKLEKVFNFVKDAQCECSISERQSGHLLGCWKPEFDQLSKEVSHE